MTYNPIVDYLAKHGDMPASSINIPGMTLAAIKMKVLNLYRAGVLTRTEEPISASNRRLRMVYGVSTEPVPAKPKNASTLDKMMHKVLKNEPEYAYHLRNLPRNQDGLTYE